MKTIIAAISGLFTCAVLFVASSCFAETVTAIDGIKNTVTVYHYNADGSLASTNHIDYCWVDTDAGSPSTAPKQASYDECSGSWTIL